MAKLTNKQIDELLNIQSKIKDAINFINQPDLKIIRLSNLSSLPENSFVNGKGENYISIDKNIGSEFAKLFTGAKYLDDFINQNINKKIV